MRSFRHNSWRFLLVVSLLIAISYDDAPYAQSVTENPDPTPLKIPALVEKEELKPLNLP